MNFLPSTAKPQADLGSAPRHSPISSSDSDNDAEDDAENPILMTTTFDYTNLSIPRSQSATTSTVMQQQPPQGHSTPAPSVRSISPGGGSTASSSVSNLTLNYPPNHPLSTSKHLCAICGDRASGKHYGVYRYMSF